MLRFLLLLMAFLSGLLLSNPVWGDPLAGISFDEADAAGESLLFTESGAAQETTDLILTATGCSTSLNGGPPGNSSHMCLDLNIANDEAAEYRLNPGFLNTDMGLASVNFTLHIPASGAATTRRPLACFTEGSFTDLGCCVFADEIATRTIGLAYLGSDEGSCSSGEGSAGDAQCNSGGTTDERCFGDAPSGVCRKWWGVTTEPILEKHCSATVTQPCDDDGDCISGETCTGVAFHPNVEMYQDDQGTGGVICGLRYKGQAVSIGESKTIAGSVVGPVNGSNHGGFKLGGLNFGGLNGAAHYVFDNLTFDTTDRAGQNYVGALRPYSMADCATAASCKKQWTSPNCKSCTCSTNADCDTVSGGKCEGGKCTEGDQARVGCDDNADCEGSNTCTSDTVGGSSAISFAGHRCVDDWSNPTKYLYNQGSDQQNVVLAQSPNKFTDFPVFGPTWGVRQDEEVRGLGMMVFGNRGVNASTTLSFQTSICPGIAESTGPTIPSPCYYAALTSAFTLTQTPSLIGRQFSLIPPAVNASDWSDFKDVGVRLKSVTAASNIHVGAIQANVIVTKKDEKPARTLTDWNGDGKIIICSTGASTLLGTQQGACIGGETPGASCGQESYCPYDSENKDQPANGCGTPGEVSDACKVCAGRHEINCSVNGDSDCILDDTGTLAGACGSGGAGLCFDGTACSTDDQCNMGPCFQEEQARCQDSCPDLPGNEGICPTVLKGWLSPVVSGDDAVDNLYGVDAVPADAYMVCGVGGETAMQGSVNRFADIARGRIIGVATNGATGNCRDDAGGTLTNVCSDPNVSGGWSNDPCYPNGTTCIEGGTCTECKIPSCTPGTLATCCTLENTGTYGVCECRHNGSCVSAGNPHSCCTGENTGTCEVDDCGPNGTCSADPAGICVTGSSAALACQFGRDCNQSHLQACKVGPADKTLAACDVFLVGQSLNDTIVRFQETGPRYTGHDPQCSTVTNAAGQVISGQRSQPANWCPPFLLTECDGGTAPCSTTTTIPGPVGPYRAVRTLCDSDSDCSAISPESICLSTCRNALEANICQSNEECASAVGNAAVNDQHCMMKTGAVLGPACDNDSQCFDGKTCVGTVTWPQTTLNNYVGVINAGRCACDNDNECNDVDSIKDFLCVGTDSNKFCRERCGCTSNDECSSSCNTAADCAVHMKGNPCTQDFQCSSGDCGDKSACTADNQCRTGDCGDAGAPGETEGQCVGDEGETVGQCKGAACSGSPGRCTAGHESRLGTCTSNKCASSGSCTTIANCNRGDCISTSSGLQCWGPIGTRNMASTTCDETTCDTPGNCSDTTPFWAFAKGICTAPCSSILCDSDDDCKSGLTFSTRWAGEASYTPAGICNPGNHRCTNCGAVICGEYANLDDRGCSCDSDDDCDGSGGSCNTLLGECKNGSGARFDCSSDLQCAWQSGMRCLRPQAQLEEYQQSHKEALRKVILKDIAYINANFDYRPCLGNNTCSGLTSRACTTDAQCDDRFPVVASAIPIPNGITEGGFVFPDTACWNRTANATWVDRYHYAATYWNLVGALSPENIVYPHEYNRARFAQTPLIWDQCHNTIHGAILAGKPFCDALNKRDTCLNASGNSVKYCKKGNSWFEHCTCSDDDECTAAAGVNGGDCVNGYCIAGDSGRTGASGTCASCAAGEACTGATFCDDSTECTLGETCERRKCLQNASNCPGTSMTCGPEGF